MISTQLFPALQLSQPISVSQGSIITITPVTAGTCSLLFSVDGITYTLWDKGAVTVLSSDLLKQSGYIKMQTTVGAWNLTINDSPSFSDLLVFRDIWGADYNSSNVNILGGTAVLTGGSINGVNIGVTSSALVKTSNFQALYFDSSGTPGNVTNNNARGRAAFAIATSTVVVTSTLVAASSTVLITLETIDATLTQILTVTPAAGSFTVTGNALATGVTKFSWLNIN